MVRFLQATMVVQEKSDICICRMEKRNSVIVEDMDVWSSMHLPQELYDLQRDIWQLIVTKN